MEIFYFNLTRLTERKKINQIKLIKINLSFTIFLRVAKKHKARVNKYRFKNTWRSDNFERGV